MKPFRIVLLPLSGIYWLLVATRNWLFDIGILKTTRFGVPVVSVGNLSTGGTGKTPFVELIAHKLRSGGHTPAIVSRGYGRASRGYVLVSDGKRIVADVKQAGDEPFLLAEKLKETPVAVAERRVEGVRRVLADSKADCIVLDDGFQHRYVGRNLDIVLLPAHETLSTQWLLPGGNRRESLGSARRADVVVISKCADIQDYHRASETLKKIRGIRTSGFRYQAKALRRVASGELIDRESLAGVRLVIAAGLGDFSSFRNSVQQLGGTIVSSVEYLDHHWYSGDDLDEIRKTWKDDGAQFVITTEKDLVRMKAVGQSFEEFSSVVPLAVLEIRPEFVAGEETIDELIEGIFA